MAEVVECLLSKLKAGPEFTNTTKIKNKKVK
jgi:hypothetical protein